MRKVLPKEAVFGKAWGLNENLVVVDEAMEWVKENVSRKKSSRNRDGKTGPPLGCSSQDRLELKVSV